MQNQENLPVSTIDITAALPQKYDVKDDSMKEFAGSTWLPRLQLFGSNSDGVKKKQIGMGEYGAVQARDITPIGEELDVLFIAWRPTAMDTHDDANIVINHDHNSEEFKRIQAQSELQNSGCFWGPEFLIWVPQSGFMTFALTSKTARNESANAMKLLGKMAHLEAVLVENKKGQSWHAPRIKPCFTTYQLPDMKDIIAQKNDFDNPKEFTAAEATPDVANSRG